jgi:hypothetical protein
MSREEAHGGDGWAFGECLWVPSLKKDGTRWPYWENLRHVRQGDVIVHLKGKEGAAAFVGSSIAASDGAETQNRPPTPQDWGFAMVEQLGIEGLGSVPGLAGDVDVCWTAPLNTSRGCPLVSPGHFKPVELGAWFLR